METCKSEYKKVIYISHPYGGKNENLEKVYQAAKYLVQKYPDYLFISPIHCFGFLYDTVDYKQGIEYCLWLFDKCDSMWVFGDYKKSVGCMTEIEYCEECNIPYEIREEMYAGC
ncbi:MAG: DUF4406 domain-containing protein [Clostridiales bacterium]|nr:DUF4406 domain-containing protein [Clostridiales bacterium]